MQAELLEPETDNRLSRFRQQDAAIAKMKAEYSLLTVQDVNDARGLKLVHAARMEVKNFRVAVEKLRKELKADSLEYGRKVDAEAKRITAMIEPIETHLEEQEAIVTREKERIKAEAEAKRKAVLDDRISKLLEVGCVLNPQNVEVMSDDSFAFLLSEATAKKAEADRLSAEKLAAEEAEKKRQAEEAARNRAELEAQRKQLEEERRKHEAEAAAGRAKLEAERKRQEAEAKAERERQQAIQEEERKKRAEEDRIRHAEALKEREKLYEEQQKLAAERKAIEVENARREAAEKAKRETEERIAREAEAKRLAEESEAARLAKIEAERPHREKVLKICTILNEIEVPQGPLHDEVLEVLADAHAQIWHIAKGDT